MITTVPMHQCLSNRHCTVKVRGSTGNIYTCTFGPSTGQYQYDWSCDCPGFKFRKSCFHIKIAELERCGWHQQFDDGEPINGLCPHCGEETEVVMVGV